MLEKIAKMQQKKALLAMMKALDDQKHALLDDMAVDGKMGHVTCQEQVSPSTRLPSKRRFF
jgi:hypothetical protein